MNGRREVCKCGHDKATHFPDETKKGPYGVTVTLHGNCLGMFCECKCYRHEDEEDPPPTVPPPTPRIPFFYPF